MEETEVRLLRNEACKRSCLARCVHGFSLFSLAIGSTRLWRFAMRKRPVCSNCSSSVDWISRIAAVALTALFVSHAPAAGQSGDYYEPPAAPSDVPPEADYVPPPPDAAVPPPPPSDNDDEAVIPPDPGSPPPPEADADHSIPPPDEAESQPPLPAQYAEPLQPGEAYHTRFSGTVSQDAAGGPV